MATWETRFVLGHANLPTLTFAARPIPPVGVPVCRSGGAQVTLGPVQRTSGPPEGTTRQHEGTEAD